MLSTNQQNIEIRNRLISRNLYTPNSEYPVKDTDATKVIKSIGSILNVIQPFRAFDLRSSFIGSTFNSTPLSEIGLVMLSKQLAYNVASRASAEYLPSMKISNLFDGKKNTKLFTFPMNYALTKKTAKTNLGQFINTVTGNYPPKNPFNKKTTNYEYLESMGEGQLDLLFNALNQNLYKSNSDDLEKIAKKIGITIKPRDFIVTQDRKYFGNEIKGAQNPYSVIKNELIPIRLADSRMRMANYNIDSIKNGTFIKNQEYAPDLVGFGRNQKEKEKYSLDEKNVKFTNKWINPDTGFSNDNIDDSIVWGRDGIDHDTSRAINSSGQRGDTEDVPDIATNDNISKVFGVKNGMLKYTQELLNSTKGRLIDITKKAIADGNGGFGFNGSALWKAPADSLFPNKIGLRQHTVLDQYDRFAKAIRFEGNKKYNKSGGNKDSVIYESVMPKIHPKHIGGNMFDNKNMMFSIENLAIRAFKDEASGLGFIDDDEGGTIPITEVGQFNGRLMWFPPYDIDLFETTSAKYESTMLVGRGEPIYSYQNSERNGTLNFTLLIDYPPQLRDKKFTGNSRHKEISEFFAFGYTGEVVPKDDDKVTIPTDEIAPTPEYNLPDGAEFIISFPNDYPVKDNDSIAFNHMFNVGYEINKKCKPSSTDPDLYDHNSFGLNSKIYEVNLDTNITADNSLIKLTDNDIYEYRVDADNGINQYSPETLESELSKKLEEIFKDDKNRHCYSITLTGHSSKLYDGNDPKEYNFQLSRRRIFATLILIDERLIKLHGKNIKEMGIDIYLEAKGDENAPDSTVSNKPSDISNRTTKESRSVVIVIKKNGKKPSEKTISNIGNKELMELTVERIENNENNDNTTPTNKIDNQYNHTFNERKFSESDKLPNASGFQNISGDYYSPVFHSQTPEEFHRRLVFLQQCMRQGNAQRTTNENGTKSIRNSVFGRQPICIIRIGDFIYSKIVIESLNVSYSDTTWDMNPEGFGMQPMLAKVTLQFKMIGGQSLSGPISALQNALSFNHYANSTFTDKGMYAKPSLAARNEVDYRTKINKAEELLLMKNNAAYQELFNKRKK